MKNFDVYGVTLCGNKLRKLLTFVRNNLVGGPGNSHFLFLKTFHSASPTERQCNFRQSKSSFGFHFCKQIETFEMLEDSNTPEELRPSSKPFKAYSTDSWENRCFALLSDLTAFASGFEGGVGGSRNKKLNFHISQICLQVWRNWSCSVHKLRDFCERKCKIAHKEKCKVPQIFDGDHLVESWSSQSLLFSRNMQIILIRHRRFSMTLT